MVKLLFLIPLFILCVLASSETHAQEGFPESFYFSHASKTRPELNTQIPIQQPHKFWDSTNIALFGGVGAARTLDFVSTRYFRSKGVDEFLLNNEIVDNKPLFFGIEMAGVAANIGVVYFLHKKGWHKTERWFSIIHIGVGTFGSIRNFSLPP